MRTNLPVTQRERDYPASVLLVSTTDVQGRITHCNRAFVEVSGYDHAELLGQPHNMIRHPDMPPEAFKDMWNTIGHGRPWTGVVKNRSKNGDHYWVKANVVPILEGRKPVGYMSVRHQPSRQEVAQAEALYARMAQERQTGRRTFRLHAGRVRQLGWRDWPNRIHRLSLSQRLAISLLGVVVGLLGGQALATNMLGWPQNSLGVMAAGLGTALLCALPVVVWFHRSVQKRLDNATRFANDMASCKLTSTLDLLHPHPLSALTRALLQTQVNLRAVVGDARLEVMGTADTIQEIARGSKDLSERTVAQASAVQRTAASMEQIASTVHQTASTAAGVSHQSTETADVAAQGSAAMAAVGATIGSIESTSQQVGSIVQIIESIAFQTNLLALNAAVEAARAGESGRGFAVVAGEVRALAKRSADSANQIRTLIGRSVEEVSHGTKQVSDANATIHRTVSEVNRVGEMIREITRATQEQSGGLADISNAVGQLDQMTQANAALVEQTAAAVESLCARTEALKRSVQVFSF